MEGEVGLLSPLLLLKLDVAVLLGLRHVLEQDAEAVGAGVLSAEGYEDEADIHLAELGEGDGIGLVVPLEGRGTS